MRPNTRIKHPQGLVLLVGLLISLILFDWLISNALEDISKDRPPMIAFGAIGAALLLMLIASRLNFSKRINYLTSNPFSGATPSMAILSFAWVYVIEKNWRAFALTISLILTAVVLLRLPALAEGQTVGKEFIAWIITIVLFLAVVAPVRQFNISRRRWWRENRKLTLAVVGILLLAFVVRFWRLNTIPFTLSGDEGSQGLEAIRVLEKAITNPFSTGWLGVPTMSFYFNSITIKFLGRTVTALRLPWAFIGSITIFPTFLLVKRLKGTHLALMTTVLLATYHYHIHFSHLGSNQIADPFFMAIALLFLFRALDRENQLDWALTGFAAGLALYFYAGARLTLVVLILVIGYQFLRDPQQFWHKHRQGIFVALVAFLIVGAPMIQYGIRFPDSFNARLNQVGIFQSGWLEREVEIRGESVGTILFDQFLRAALAFNFYPDRTVWYGLRQPLLSPFFGGVFLLGLGYGTLRLFGKKADSRLAPMVAWWWCGMILGGMLTESPPSSQRLITLSIPVCFFIALVLWELVQIASQSIKEVPKKALLFVSVLIFALSSLNTYFLDYTPQRIYGGPYAELATEIAPLLRELKDDHRIYFIGAPWMYWGFATLPYLVPGADAVDIAGPVADVILLFEETSKKPGAVYIFLPQRLEELTLVQQLYPNGKTIEFYSPVDGRLMVTLYKVSPTG